MDTENNNPNVRIAIGRGLIIMGGILAGPAMNRILQPEPWPCWAIILLIIGCIVLVAGLLILVVPPKNWKCLRYSVLGVPGWLRNLYLWMKYGPKYSFGKPSIKQPLPDHQDTYKATITLHIENRDNNPLIVHFSLARFNMEQRVGRRMIRIELKLPIGFPHEEVIESQKERDFNIPFIGFRDETDCLDLGKNYQRGIQGIQVELSGVGRKELHKGLYCKPTQEYHIGVF